MAYTTINKPTDYFNTVLYTGNGSTQSITGVGFTQNFTWIKSRSTVQNHYAFDTVRGAQKQIYPSTTSAEDTGQSNGLNAFTSDGFNLGTETGVNDNGATFVSWNWKAGTSFTNDASATGIGSIDSSGSVNTDAGFSIISWTNAGSGVATVAHGLGAVPKMIIIKSRNETAGWLTYHEAIGNTKALFLNTTGAEDDNAELFNDTSPTSTVFTTGITGLLTGGSNLIAYCFAEKQGFSKFGSYAGSGSVDGPFIFTGFKPAFFMIKNATVGGNWTMFDNKRSSSGGSNEIDYSLDANVSNAEETGTSVNDVDFLSNGIKIREDNGDLNGSGQTILYMAFAEAPLVGSNNVPCTAR